MWQAKFERFRDRGFTVVGIALDSEGAAPAKRYYDRHGVTFPALVDPNYATGFGAVPKTFFVDEHGVVRPLDGWESLLPASPDDLRPATDELRRQWTKPGDRLASSAIAALLERHTADSSDLATAVELSSRYLDLQLADEARVVLLTTVSRYDSRTEARSNDGQTARLLGHAHLQLARASAGDRDAVVEHATLSFYLNPSVGFGKQIARLIAPEKFDRPDGTFDNEFREATLTRLQRERQQWLDEDGPSAARRRNQ